ncbi:hypothetical protein KUF71_002326 [Frankliniella fusca]|uniref:RNA-directed DNA polymerase n=1 Tax=Frankliniella fusca TaxID=407009 RepID=A0AAE1HMB8_9NEOP|nr:hypothetical protein KUF71_002326 [Frankliniella fusca]
MAIPAPKPVELGSQLEKSWRQYKSGIEIWLQASGKSGQSDEIKAGVLMAFMGHEALDQFPAWGITDAMKKDYKLLIAQIDKQVSPKDFPISRRLMFRHRKRRENEDIDDYIIELLKLSEGCEFEDKEQEHMIIDNLVDSITDTALQQFIIRKNHTDYKELVSAIKESEKLNEVSQAIAIKNGNGSSIHHLKYSTSRAESRAPSKSSYQSRSSKYKPYKNDSRSRHHQSNHHRSRSRSVSFAPSRSQSRSMSRSKSKSRSRSRSHSHHRSKTRKPTPGPDNVRKRPCQRCDSRHKFGECPAEGYQCKKCNYFGHFTRCCKTSLKKVDSLIVTKRIETTLEKNTEPDDYVLIHSILTKSAEPEWYEEIRVKTKRIRFKLDPGSDIDTLPMSYLKMLNMKVEDLSKPETRALLYGKVEISILGKITLPITCRDKSGELTFYVIEAQDVPLLSRHTCVALNLVQRIPPSVHSIKTHNNEIPDITKEISDENIRKFVESNIDVFTGTGQFPDTVSLMIDKKIEPQRKPARRLPKIISDKLQAHLQELVQQDIIEECPQPRSWVSNSLIREKSDEKIKKATKEDQQMQELVKYVYEGWPDSKTQLPEKLKPYWQNRDKVHEENGMLFFESRAIIPESLRETMLKKLHHGHLGISKTNSLAVETVYWPGLYRDITNMIHACKTCATFQPQKKKEEMVLREIPTRAWSHLATDILHFGGTDYLVVQDIYSKWLEILKLKNKSAKEINTHLEELFHRFGVPDIVYSDNNPFNSTECQSLTEILPFRYVYSSPNYPQSNGQAEKAVDIAKRRLEKCREDKSSISLALLNYRNMKIPGLNATPAQLMFNRRMKTTLPISDEMLQPEVQTEVQEKLKQRQEKAAEYYNRTASKKEVRFEEKEPVLITDGRKNNWKPAVIIKKSTTAPRSYLVKNEKGHEVVRTSRHIRKSYSPKLTPLSTKKPETSKKHYLWYSDVGTTSTSEKKTAEISENQANHTDEETNQANKTEEKPKSPPRMNPNVTSPTKVTVNATQELETVNSLQEFETTERRCNRPETPTSAKSKKNRKKALADQQPTRKSSRKPVPSKRYPEEEYPEINSLP